MESGAVPPDGPMQLSGAKRAQVAIACNGCRSRKIKCDGVRPVCSKCAHHQRECIYAAAPDASPMVVLKRKHDALQRKHEDVNELLSQLKSVSQTDAYRILEFLREGEDVTSALEFARALPAPGAPAEQLFTTFRGQNVVDGSLTAVPYGGYSSNASVALDLNGGRDRHDRILRPDSGPSGVTLPPVSTLLASVRELTSPSPPPQRRTRIRRSPSAPDLRQSISVITRRPSSVPIYSIDDRLRYVRAQDWGITYVDDVGFRNILSSFFTWDHPSTRTFDEDNFINGLLKKPSDTFSVLLVHVILAYGSLNYTHVDTETAAHVHKAAWSECERLWDQETNGQDDLANAASGLPYMLQTRRITTNMGLYDKRRAAQVYDPSRPRTSRAKAILAWGMYNWVALAEFGFRESLGFDNPPPVDPPRSVDNPSADLWSPWPWPRTGRPIPCLRDELLVAYSGLTPLVKEIIPLQREHSVEDLSLPYLQATLELYQRFRGWWETLNPALKSSELLDKAPPHAFFPSLMYNFAVGELFRPFTATPMYPSPHEAPLRQAGLPVEPAMSTAAAAVRQSRGLVRHLAKVSTHDQFMGLLVFFAMPVAFETLPTASSLSLGFDPDAGLSFLAALQIIYHSGNQFPVTRYAALGIEQTASKMHIVVPGDALQMFEDIKRRIVANNDRETNRSDWVVVLNTTDTDLQGSRLNNLIKELDKMGI